jgi:hypothetical protein
MFDPYCSDVHTRRRRTVAKIHFDIGGFATLDLPVTITENGAIRSVRYPRQVSVQPAEAVGCGKGFIDRQVLKAVDDFIARNVRQSREDRIHQAPQASRLQATDAPTEDQH